MKWELGSPICSDYLSHCSHLFFHEHSHGVSAFSHMLRLSFPLLTPLFSRAFTWCFRHFTFMLSQNLITQTSLVVLFTNLAFCQSPLRRSCQYSYFDTCSRLCPSAASACNWASHCTFNVMVLKCMHFIPCITLNVSQTGHSVASQLGF